MSSTSLLDKYSPADDKLYGEFLEYINKQLPKDKSIENKEPLSYVYLLLDSTKAPNLHARIRAAMEQVPGHHGLIRVVFNNEEQGNSFFDEFVKAIFYVGKGCHARYLDHLRDALNEEEEKENEKEKITRIKEIWKSSGSVVVAISSPGSASHKAKFIESVIIETIVLKNLTNIINGIEITQFSELQTKYLAKKFLIQAFNAFILFDENAFDESRTRGIFNSRKSKSENDPKRDGMADIELVNGEMKNLSL